ncbi:MAG: tetratricopeptide repeat protein [Lentisphaerae bacterium]|nr:tetratricopeptide repeat protein [Lentisphaerota bacterium]MCP4101871.1 tetratricopeptide repeat protein [Lentisphaerota bacterium]
MTRWLPLYLLGTVILAFFSLQPMALGYDNDFSPWEAWRQGFSYYEKGEQYKEKGEPSEALRWFQKALKSYSDVKKARPDWNQRIIGNRIKMCRREISKLAVQVETPRRNNTSPSPPFQKERRTTSYAPKTQAADSGYYGELSSQNNDLKVELQKYKKKLFAVLVELDEARRELKQRNNSTEQIESMMRGKRLLNHKYNLLMEKYEALETKLSKPDSEKTNLKNQLIEEKMQADILTQRLKMQKQKENELRSEMTELYRLKTAQKMQIQEFQNSIKGAQRKIDIYQKQKSLERIEKRNLSSKIVQLDKSNKQAELRLSEKDEEIEKLNKWLMELRKQGGNQSKLNKEIAEESKKINEKYNELKREFDTASTEKQALIGKLRNTNMEMVQVKKALQNIDQQKRMLFQEYQILRKKYDELEICEKSNSKDLLQTQKRNRKLEAQVNMFVNKYDKMRKRHERRTNTESQNVLSLNRKNKELTQIIENKKIAYEDLSDRYNSTSKNLSGLKKIIIKLKNDLKRLTVENKILAQDKTKLAEVSKAYIDLKEKTKILQKYKDKIAALNLERDKLQTRIRSLSLLKNKITELQKKNQELSDDSSKLKMSMNDFLKIREQLNSAKTKIAEWDRLQKTNLALSEKCSKQTEQCALLNEKLKIAISKVRKHTKLKNDFSNISSSLKEANQKNASLLKEIDNLVKIKKSNTDLKAKLASLIAENSHNEKHYQANLKKQNVLITKLTEEQQTLNTKVRMAEALQNQMQTLGNQLTALKKVKENNVILKKNIETLTAQNRLLSSKQLDKKKLVQQFNIMNKNHAQLEKKYNDLMQKSSALQSELSQKDKQIDSINITYNKLKKSILGNENNLNQKIAGLKTSLNNKTKQIHILHEKLKYNEKAAQKIKVQQSKLAMQAKNNIQKIVVQLKSTNDDLKKRLIEAHNSANKNTDNIAALENRNKHLVLKLEKNNRRVKYLERKNNSLALNSQSRHIIDVASAPQLKKLLSGGIKAEKNGSDDVAIWHYRKYLESNPKNADVNRRLGTILMQRNQLQEAAPLLQRAYLLNPKDKNTALNYGHVLISQNKAGNACTVLAKAIEQNPDNYSLMVTYGIALTKAGNKQKAENLLKIAIKQNPQQPDAYLQMAKLLSDSKKQKDYAANCYRKAKKLGSKPVPTLEKSFAKQLSDNSEMTAFLSKAAVEAEKGKDWVSAAWYFNQLLKLEPENKSFRYKLATAQLIQDQFKTARNTIEPLSATYAGVVISSAVEAGMKNYSAANLLISKSKKLPKNKEYTECKHMLDSYLKLSKQKNPTGKFKQYLTKLEKVI